MTRRLKAKPARIAKRRIVVEAIGVVEIGDVLARLAESRDLQIAVDAEGLAHRNRDVGLIEREPPAAAVGCAEGILVLAS